MGIITGTLHIFFKTIKKILSVLIDFTAKVLIYFGLYIPFLWFIIGCIFTLFNIFNADIFKSSAPLFDVFWAVFVICCIISVGITVNHIFVKPIKFFFKDKDFSKEDIIKKHHNIDKHIEEVDNDDLATGKDHSSYKNMNPNREKNNDKTFKVFKSTKYPDIIIHDYPEYRVYFKYIDGRLVLLGKKYK